jgi:hypothetical protein
LRQFLKFVTALALSVSVHIWHIWRDYMLKTFGGALLLASGLAITGTAVLFATHLCTQQHKNSRRSDVLFHKGEI